MHKFRNYSYSRDHKISQDNRIIATLDIGSSKVTALVARLLSTQEIELIGMGIAPSVGVKSGSITNIEQIVNSIREAIEEAEIMTNIGIEQVVLNITGKHVRGDNSVGVIAITNKERLVTSQDIYRAIEAAQAVRIPPDHGILHVLSREFKVDDQNAIKDPTGMIGIRLEADVHIVTGHLTHIHNTEKSVQESGIQVCDKVLSSVASSLAVLTNGEKELGVAVADIGAGIIDIIIYTEGGVSYTSTICLGASHVTHDISIGLKTPLYHAEALKTQYGSCLASEIDPSEMIEIPVVGARPPKSVPKKDLVEIIEARVREILELIDHELIKSGKKSQLAGGLVLTGGGSLLEGLSTLSEKVIDLSTAIGYPKEMPGLAEKVSSPIFSTAMGLLQYGSRYNSFHIPKSGTGKIFTKLKVWLQENL